MSSTTKPSSDSKRSHQPHQPKIPEQYRTQIQQLQELFPLWSNDGPLPSTLVLTQPCSISSLRPRFDPERSRWRRFTCGYSHHRRWVSCFYLYLSSLQYIYQAMRNNGVPFHAKRTKNPPLIRDRLRTLHPEREANPEEAEADAVGVGALVVVALFAVVVLPLPVTLTAIILTLTVALLHHLLQMATLTFPLIPGGNQLRLLALIATPAGAVRQRLKLEHGVTTPTRPGVQPQLLMAPQPPLLLSSHSLFLRLVP